MTRKALTNLDEVIQDVRLSELERIVTRQVSEINGLKTYLRELEAEFDSILSLKRSEDAMVSILESQKERLLNDRELELDIELSEVYDSIYRFVVALVNDFRRKNGLAPIDPENAVAVLRDFETIRAANPVYDFLPIEKIALVKCISDNVVKPLL